MKKRIFKLALAALTLSVFLIFAVSCSDSGKVNDALEDTRELEGVDADVYFNVYATHGSLSKRIQAVEHIVASGNQAVITVGEYEKAEKTVYVNGADVYFDGYRQNRSEYEMYNGSHTAFVYDLLNFQMDDILFEKAEISESAGKFKVKKTFDEEEERELFNEMLKPFFNNIERRMNNLVGCGDCQRFSERCDDCKFKDALYEGTSLELVIKDGYVERIRVKFDMFATLDGVETTLNADIEMNINNPGKDVSVEMPTGYESFESYKMTTIPVIENWFKKK